MPLSARLSPSVTPACLVLDTNVVLDWLVFGDPAIAPLVAALGAGELRWHVTAAMRDELASVLGRGGLDAWKPEPATLWAAWARWSHPAEAAPVHLARPLRCTDPDDQKFIDLALQLRPATLLSRDRAVLRLARPAAVHGVDIATPAAWAARRPSGLAPAAPRP